MSTVTPAPTVPAIPELLPLGDSAYTLCLGNSLSPELATAIDGWMAAIASAHESGKLPALIECVPTLAGLTLHYDPRHPEADKLPGQLARLAPSTASHTLNARHWDLPVCFNRDMAPDLADVAERCDLSSEAVIALITGTCFRVAMLGFLPGFPYLGGLPQALHLPRRATPRAAVPANSLAIAGAFCAIYPNASPGGWHLLGRSPVPLFDLREGATPALFRAGDTVHFHAISKDEFTALSGRFGKREAILDACLKAQP